MDDSAPHLQFSTLAMTVAARFVILNGTIRQRCSPPGSGGLGVDRRTPGHRETAPATEAPRPPGQPNNMSTTSSQPRQDGGAVTISVEALAGQPGQVLCAAAGDADLLVVGRSGHGSVTENLWVRWDSST